MGESDLDSPEHLSSFQPHLLWYFLDRIHELDLLERTFYGTILNDYMYMKSLVKVIRVSDFRN